MANLVEIAPVVVERKSFKICKYILAISKVSPLEKGQSPYLNKFESPFPIDALRKGWLKLAQWFWRRCKCANIITTTRRQQRRTTDTF